MTEEKKERDLSKWIEAGRAGLIRAGMKNMARYNQEVAEGKRPPPRLTHGLTSVRKQRKFSDARTREGKRLKELLASLVSHLGGAEAVTPVQRIHLEANIRSKLIVLMCISEYLENLETLIDGNGELIAVLSKNYVAYSNGLRNDFIALAHMSGKQVPPDLDGYVKAVYGISKGRG